MTADHDDLRTFALGLLEHLGIEPPEQLTPTTELFGELGLDSSAAIEMLLYIEELTDSRLSFDEVPLLLTLGDVYSYRAQLLDGRPSGCSG